MLIVLLFGVFIGILISILIISQHFYIYICDNTVDVNHVLSEVATKEDNQIKIYYLK